MNLIAVIIVLALVVVVMVTMAASNAGRITDRVATPIITAAPVVMIAAIVAAYVMGA